MKVLVFRVLVAEHDLDRDSSPRADHGLDLDFLGLDCDRLMGERPLPSLIFEGKVVGLVDSDHPGLHLLVLRPKELLGSGNEVARRGDILELIEPHHHLF